jgi:hypothetical protein
MNGWAEIGEQKTSQTGHGQGLVSPVEVLKGP